MRISVEIEVERSDEIITVDVEGTFEHFGSYNPHERGLRLSGYNTTVDGKPFDLTKEEAEAAEEKLYDKLYEV